MNITDLKIIFRSFRNQKMSSILSILVLSAGMVSFIIIFLFIQFEKSYDKSWNGSERIYRVALEKTQKNGNTTRSASNYGGLPRVIAAEIPEVEFATGLWEDAITVYTHDNYLKDVRLFWSDSTIFSVFKCDFIAGSGANPFPTLQSAVLSESAAIRLFGRNDPVNEKFKLNEGWEFTVTGIFKDIPANSHLKIDFLISRESLFYYLSHYDYTASVLRIEHIEGSSEPPVLSRWLWQNPQSYTYIRLKNNVNIASVEQKFDAIYNKYTQHLLSNSEKSKFILQPVQSIHFDSHFDNELSPNSDRNTIIALNIIAWLILFMSWIIFINFQITQSMDRVKEFGLKKIAGAGFSDLCFQIFARSALINLTGLMLALIFFFDVREPLGQYLGVSFTFNTATLLPGFIAILLLGTFADGFYPMVSILTKSAHHLISKNFIRKNDSFNFRRNLVVFQFTASVGLIIASSVIMLQVQYMKKKKIGLDIQNTIYSYTPMSLIKKPGQFNKIRAFMDDVNQIPGIRGVTVSSSIPGEEINIHTSSVFMPDNPANKGDNFGIITINHRYEEVFEPEVIAGRMFNLDDRTGYNQVVVNEEAVSRLGYHKPEDLLGKYVMISSTDYVTFPETSALVIGVIKDFHQESLRKPIGPLLLINEIRWKNDVGYISFRLDGTDQRSAIEIIKRKWEQYYPDDPFSYRFTSDTYMEQIDADIRLGAIFSCFTGLSIFLAALGLLGLAADSAKKRTKEIGIRKVNGARIQDVIILLNKDMILWIAIAFSIATPVSWYAMHKWLGNFSYRISLDWWIFGAAGFIALAVALLTVGLLTWKAAEKDPVDCLRYE
jgi:putative ABC transport system permease protein